MIVKFQTPRGRRLSALCVVYSRHIRTMSRIMRTYGERYVLGRKTLSFGRSQIGRGGVTHVKTELHIMRGQQHANTSISLITMIVRWSPEGRGIIYQLRFTFFFGRHSEGSTARPRGIRVNLFDHVASWIVTSVQAIKIITAWAKAGDGYRGLSSCYGISNFWHEMIRWFKRYG